MTILSTKGEERMNNKDIQDSLNEKSLQSMAVVFPNECVGQDALEKIMEDIIDENIDALMELSK